MALWATTSKYPEKSGREDMARMAGRREAAAGGVPLSGVWRTSSYLESVQWELDAACESLKEAVQQATGSGGDYGALLQAANMTSQELEAALLDAPSAWPARIQPTPELQAGNRTGSAGPAWAARPCLGHLRCCCCGSRAVRPRTRLPPWETRSGCTHRRTG